MRNFKINTAGVNSKEKTPVPWLSRVRDKMRYFKDPDWTMMVYSSPASKLSESLLIDPLRLGRHALRLSTQLGLGT